MARRLRHTDGFLNGGGDTPSPTPGLYIKHVTYLKDGGSESRWAIVNQLGELLKDSSLDCCIASPEQTTDYDKFSNLANKQTFVEQFDGVNDTAVISKDVDEQGEDAYKLTWGSYSVLVYTSQYGELVPELPVLP